MIKIFISYHHVREQDIKNYLSKIIQKLNFFLNLTNDTTLNMKDKSIIPEDIDDTNLADNEIYKIIREEYLKDTDVTIVILGQETKCRKFIDKEIQSSLTRYGSLNRRKKPNGLIILLTNDFIKAATDHKNDLENIDYTSLITSENAGKRIYENCRNDYAVIDTFQNIEKDNNKLIKLIDQSLLNAANKTPNKEVPFIINNIEVCAKSNEESKIITKSNQETTLYVNNYPRLEKQKPWNETKHKINEGKENIDSNNKQYIFL